MKTISVTSLDVVTSTSDHLLDALNAGAPEGTAFRANVQIKGRGRQGRDWVSPRGNLYVSILLKPRQPKSVWPSLSLVAGLALYEAILPFRDADDLGLKWPNDLLYQGRKCAGLLLEAQDDAIMLGCGVNLYTSPDKTEGWPPISLNHDITMNALDADMLMASLSETLVMRYNEWNNHGFGHVKQDWIKGAAHIGQDVIISLTHDKIEGRFDDVDDTGNLCLTDATGTCHRIAQGDVVRAGVKHVTSH